MHPNVLGEWRLEDSVACFRKWLTLHKGEYQIAQAFSTTLVNGFSIGTSPIAIPASLPVRPISIPTGLQAVSSVEGITVTWNEVYGAMGYEIQYQVIGTGVWNTWSVTESRYDTSDVLDGWEIEFMIRTSNGDTLKSEVGMLILTLPSLLYSLLVKNLLASETSFCRFRASKSLDFFITKY